MGKSVQAAVEVAPELSPEQDAEAFLVESAKAEAGANDTAATGKGKAPKDDAETNPDEDTEQAATDETEDDDPAEPAAKSAEEELRLQRKLYAQKLNEVDSRFAAVRRKEQAFERTRTEFEATKKEVTEQQRQLANITDVNGWVAFVAKNAKVQEAQVLHELADFLRSGGKRSPESEAAREIREWRAEQQRERDEKAQREREEAERQEAAQNEEIRAKYPEVMGKLARENPSQWPHLAKLSPRIVGPAALRVVEAYFEKTGEVPSQNDVLDYLEGIEVEDSAQPAPAVTQQTRGTKPKTLTNADAEARTVDRELSDEERCADAAAYLRSFGKQK